MIFQREGSSSLVNSYWAGTYLGIKEATSAIFGRSCLETEPRIVGLSYCCCWWQGVVVGRGREGNKFHDLWSVQNYILLHNLLTVDTGIRYLELIIDQSYQLDSIGITSYINLYPLFLWYLLQHHHCYKKTSLTLISSSISHYLEVRVFFFTSELLSWYILFDKHEPFI